MSVATVSFWMVPCTPLLATEVANTPPDVCSPNAACETSASKAVFVSL